MAKTFLTVGVVHSLVQNEVYAMPPFQTAMLCDTGAAVFEKSTVETFATNSSVNFTNGVAPMPGACFIRLTSAGPVNVSLTRQ